MQNPTCTLKGATCADCYCTDLIKNCLKTFFSLAAYVWEAAPCSTLPTADENAATVCSDHSVFQLVPVTYSC